MMDAVFPILLKMSLQASLLIGVVLVIRIFIKRLPKIYSCLLWLLVLFRLLCPVFFESSFSLIPQNYSGENTPVVSENGQQTFVYSNQPTNSGIPENNNYKTPVNKPDGNKTAGAAAEAAKDLAGSAKGILFSLWLAGTIVMALFHILQYMKMKRKTAAAIQTEKNVWECEGIHSPFVMGCVKPRIYLPFRLEGAERRHILSHERKHILHCDPQLRLLGITALCLHWWNPLVWLAVHQMNQDREMFCDESVLKNADMDTKKQYSNTLLQFSMRQSKLAVTLSFGETNTENRIRHILKYHKPKVIVSGLLFILIAGCAVAFLTVPRMKEVSTILPASTTMESKETQLQVETKEPGETTEYHDGSATNNNAGESDSDSNAGNENPIITDPNTFTDLVLASVKTENKKEFASLIKYPITVSIDEKQAVINKADDFLLDYDRIVNENFKSKVLATDTGNLFTNQYGVMLGNGAIWFDTFDAAGYRIYAINNSDKTILRDEDAFKTSWTNKTLHLGMTDEERNAWYAKIVKDIPHAEESYEIWGLAYDDLDRDGNKDLMLQIKSASGAITPDSYPGAYLGIYMDNDPVYLKAYDSSLYLGFLQVLHGDIDKDGYQEILYNIFTGGNGGAGSSEKAVLKYRNHALEKMRLPGDNSGQFTDGTDAGYVVKVLFGDGINKYKAICDSLGRIVLFQAKNAVNEDGSPMSPHITENAQAGANSRGYAEFSIINKNGREYLRAREYLHGEGGINHCVGWATYLMDWDENGKPAVLEFGVDEINAE